MRPFRFLAPACDGPDDPATVIANARKAESLGYSGVITADHLVDMHSPVPLLATVAAVTQTLRIGTFVLNSELRHPAVLAQDLASLDVLSGGRLDIGVGAGWNRPEHDAIGLPFPPVGDRVARLAETVTVLKGCFGAGPWSYQGRFFTITDHDGRPEPVQRPHPPIFIGGGGRRTLTLAGREAGIIGLAPRLMPGDQRPPVLDPRSITAAATAEKISWVREAAGDRFADLEINTYPSGGPPIITSDPLGEAQAVADRITERSGLPITAQEVLDSPHVFIGTVDSLTEKFHGLRERFGITSIMVGDMDVMAPVVERLAGS